MFVQGLAQRSRGATAPRRTRVERGGGGPEWKWSSQRRDRSAGSINDLQGEQADFDIAYNISILSACYLRLGRWSKSREVAVGFPKQSETTYASLDFPHCRR